MTILADLLPVFAAFLVVAVSPGPANIAVATLAMRKGRGAAMRFGAGLGFGLAIWGIVAATGMGAVLQSSAYVLTALKLFGGAYLLWLAYKSWKSSRAPALAVEAAAHEGRWFWRGLILNLSNPKAVVAWMAALSMGMGNDGSFAVLAMATLVCMAIGFANYFGHAAAFSITGFMRAYAAAQAWIEGVVAAVFAVAGLGLIRSALSR